jgi:hypothetical protein
MRNRLKKKRRQRKESALVPFNSLPIPTKGNITPDMLDDLEAMFFSLIEKGTPGIWEIDVPVTHTFTNHTYIREGIMPKGALIIGHCHKEPHHCVVLKGRMSILNSDRTVTEIVAPCAFLAGPGRKIVFIHEDVLMQNIHPTEGWDQELFTDVDKMEEGLYKRTDSYKRHRLKITEQKAIEA